MKKDRPLVVFIVGPTAVGKSDIAFELAKKINGEIISADSMQVYRGLDKATSKPPAQYRKQIPHHLIDILEPSADYSAADFKDKAESLARTIILSGKTPIIAGGTGLYVKVLLDGLFPGAKADWSLRERLAEEAESFGIERFYQRLSELDPEAASKIKPNDLRRIIRALEVYETSKNPISKLQKNTRGIADKYEIKIFGIDMDRAQLYNRIDQRVDKMFEQGLLEEARALLNEKLSRSASQAIGYKEVFGYLRREYSLEEASRILKRDTRRFAKRQMTWFRKDKRIAWIHRGENDIPQKIASTINDKIQNPNDK